MSTVCALHIEHHVHYSLWYVPSPPRATAKPPIIHTTPLIPNSLPSHYLSRIDGKPLSRMPNTASTGTGQRLVRRFPLHLTAHQPLAYPRADKLALIPMALRRRSPPHASSQWRRRRPRHGTLPAVADGELGLKGGGVDAVCAEALVDVLRRLDECRNGLV